MAGRSLGVATASLVKLLDPDSVVLGGIYAVLAPWLRDPFQRALLAGIPMTRAAPPRAHRYREGTSRHTSLPRRSMARNSEESPSSPLTLMA